MIGWTPHYLPGKLLFVFSLCLIVYVIFLSPFFASVLLRWLRCCSSVWQPSHFWGIPWVWRGASIRFSPNLFKPSGLNGRQSVRRGDGSSQRWRIWVSQGKQPACMTRFCLVTLLWHEECVLSLSGKLKLSFVCLKEKILRYKTKIRTPKDVRDHFNAGNSCVESSAFEMSACNFVRKCRGVFSVCI